MLEILRYKKPEFQRNMEKIKESWTPNKGSNNPINSPWLREAGDRRQKEFCDPGEN